MLAKFDVPVVCGYHELLLPDTWGFVFALFSQYCSLSSLANLTYGEGN